MREIICGSYRLSLDRPLVMGIVNLTADSFSGDGLAADMRAAISHAEQQLRAGADILDIGAESTRPGAIPAPVDVELSRLLPVLAEVRQWGVPISVDTYKPAVMRAVLAEGASMINDIKGMVEVDALAAVAASDCAVCIMHMQGDPGTMQSNPSYDDVLADVRAFLDGALERCIDHGLARERLLVDPGFCFGKTLAHNLELLRYLRESCPADFPILAGLSRKSMLGAITGREVGERLSASIAAALLAVQKGASLVRVHDVAATRDALAVLAALEGVCGD